MSTTNQVQRENVCLCPKVSYGGGWVDGVWVEPVRAVLHHDTECPFFEDYSTSVSESDNLLSEYEQTLF